jgi:hypothetical protein
MEQFIVSSNSALELKLGNFYFLDNILHLTHYFFLTVRKASDINDPKIAFYPEMTYQVFGIM